MSVVVQKYGGSSVADLDKLGRVADRVQATVEGGHQVVVVVSAMGNTTNELLGLARQVTQTPDRRELDMLISVGERVTMSLLAIALRDRGVRAVSLTGSQSGIITDEAHADAKVVEVRPARVQAALDAGLVVIVAGFQGVSRTREVTTLGRGGSDTTAVVLAAALQADYCEICSDVDGVWSADPRRVEETVRLDDMTLDEALALARGGAKVLFEDAVRYARDQGVDVVARSTFGPGAGTRIRAGDGPDRAIAVTGDVLECVKLGSDERASDVERVVAQGGRVRRRVGDVLYVDMRNAHGGLTGLAAALHTGAAAMVTAVGSGLGEDARWMIRAEEALREGGLAPVQAGASADTVWWVVDPAEIDEAVRRLHAYLRTDAA